MSKLLSRSVLLAAALSAGAPAVASAAVPAAAASAPCTATVAAPAFAKVDRDPAQYSVAPGGSFEADGDGWTLAAGARITSGNETLGVTGGSRELSLPIGGVATSPKFCVDETNPTFRFAFKVDGVGAGFLARIVYQRADGLHTAQLLSSQQLKFFPSQWAASPISPLATLLPLSGGAATVQIQLVGITVPVANVFAAVAKPLVSVPAVSIDSVMVDPYRRS